jgi:hypothetical protein
MICNQEKANDGHWVIIEEIARICLFLSSRQAKDKLEVFTHVVELRCLCQTLQKIDIPIEEVGDVVSALRNCLFEFPTKSVSETVESIREKIL